MKRPFQIMKFGGTSLGDASSIERVVGIIRNAARESSVAVVVSAMSGVTNRLIDAANQSKAGSDAAVTEIFGQLRKRHGEVVMVLIHSEDERRRLKRKLDDLFAEGERLCQATILVGELTPRTLDAISGLGERLCAPLVAAALLEAGIGSEAMDATELVITDSYHGGAEPRIDLTRARCRTRVTPVLQKGIVPVVTGFIGATEEGILTTLGRGGSDYSATILGAALDADEVVIWSDVTGLLTADPKLVADACTISEISYGEAAELAYFGAKVLHPKALRPVMQTGIPIWIKNTFAADESGTKITPAGPRNARGVKALTAIPDAALITVAGVGTQGGRKGVHDSWARTVATAAAVRADVLLISQSPSHNGISLVVASSPAKRTVEALRQEFSQDLVRDGLEYTVFEAAVSVIILVGQNMGAASETVARAFTALSDENVNIIATAQGASDCSMAFAVPQQDMEIALASIHRELELVGLPSNRQPVTVAASPSSIWKYESEQASAD
jgi:aspartokinase/homoserine dehydrogenase 1